MSGRLRQARASMPTASPAPCSAPLRPLGAPSSSVASGPVFVTRGVRPTPVGISLMMKMLESAGLGPSTGRPPVPPTTDNPPRLLSSSRGSKQLPQRGYGLACADARGRVVNGRISALLEHLACRPRVRGSSSCGAAWRSARLAAADAGPDAGRASDAHGRRSDGVVVRQAPAARGRAARRPAGDPPAATSITRC